jgi:hypothetical protein
MVNVITRTFDFASFNSKLKNWFVESAPMYASYTLGSSFVKVVNDDTRKEVYYQLDFSLDVKKNVHGVLEACQEIFPKMVDAKRTHVPFTQREKERLIKLYPVEKILEIEQSHFKVTRDWYTIDRIGLRTNSFTFYGGSNSTQKYIGKLINYTGKLFLEKMNSQMTPEDKYLWVVGNSEIRPQEKLLTVDEID